LEPFPPLPEVFERPKEEPNQSESPASRKNVALFSYEPTGPDEIGFQKGEEVTVLQTEGNHAFDQFGSLNPPDVSPNPGTGIHVGWWLGETKQGKKGLFPAGYVSLS